MNLTIHECTHSRTGLFRCTNCPRQYTTHAAMDNHRLTHQGKKYTCPKWPYFSMDTEPNSRQHTWGKHGKGWCTPCGKRFDWPPKMFRHQKMCEKCQNITEKAASRTERLAAKLAKK